MIFNSMIAGIQSRIEPHEKNIQCQNSEKERYLAIIKNKSDEIITLENELVELKPTLKVQAIFDKLIEDTYTPVDIKIQNAGKGPAYDVECQLRGPIEGEGNVKFQMIEEEAIKRLSLKPTARGKMRWIYNLTYRDARRAKYSEEPDQWIDSASFLHPTQINIAQQGVHSQILGIFPVELIVGKVLSGPFAIA